MKNTLKYSLHLQKNPVRPNEEKKAFATLQLNGVLDINSLADHMTDHNSVYSKGTIVGVITDMCHCIKEAILDGNAVELGDLGRFTPSITSEGTVATTDAEGNPVTAMEAFTADNIKAVNVNYELGDGLELNLDKFTFEYVTTRKAQAAAKRAQKKGESNADWSEPEEENEG